MISEVLSPSFIPLPIHSSDMCPVHRAGYVCTEHAHVTSSRGTVSWGTLTTVAPHPSLGGQLSSPFTPTPPPHRALSQRCYFSITVVAIPMTKLYWPSSGLTRFSQRGQVITSEACRSHGLCRGGRGVAVRGSPTSVFGGKREEVWSYLGQDEGTSGVGGGRAGPPQGSC